jgi:hypothetical protein
MNSFGKLSLGIAFASFVAVSQAAPVAYEVNKSLSNFTGGGGVIDAKI